MPSGASRKREREYEDLKREFQREGRYKGREEEVAARIVNKQRAAMGETQEERRKDRTGASPDEGLPIEHYDRQTIDEITREVQHLSGPQIGQVRAYEEHHKHRATLLPKLARAEQAASQRMRRVRVDR